jgi:hypothetical protein
MLHFSLWGWAEAFDRIDANLRRLWLHPARIEELLHVIHVLRERTTRVTRPVYPHGSNPLQIHASNTLPE